MNNRILAMLLAIIMIVSIVPVNAFAAENGHLDGCRYEAPCTCESEMAHMFKVSFGGGCEGHPCTMDCANQGGSTGGTNDDTTTDDDTTTGGTVTPTGHTHKDENGPAGTPNCICDVDGCKEAVHQLKYFAEVPATCTEGGRTAFYWCEKCEKYFSDAEAKTEIEQAKTYVAAAGHKLTKHEKVESTCIEQGHMTYFECETCGKFFKNEAATESDVVSEGYVLYDLAEHTLEYVNDGAAGHHKECTVEGCGYTEEQIPHNTFRYENGKKYCVNCGQEVDHTCVDEDGDCKCDVAKCGFAMEHELVWKIGTDNHYQWCGNENCAFREQTKTETEAHYDEGHDCICDACGGQMKHTLIDVEAKDATCAVDGNVAHKKCTNCNGTFDDEGKVIDPVTTLDHWEMWVQDEENGTHYKVCRRSACQEVLSEPEAHEVPSFPSVYDTVHQGVCSICNLTVTAEHYDSPDDEDCSCDDCGKFLGHTLIPVAEVKAKCGVAGNVAHQLCTNCGKTLTTDGTAFIDDVTIKARDHWKVWKYDVETDTHRQVCKYSDCNAVIVEPTDHDYVYTDIGNGKHTATCPTCKYGAEHDHVDEDMDCYCDDCEAFLGHKPVLHKGFEATCEVPGEKWHYECQCGKYFWDQACTSETTAEAVVIPAPGHEPAEGAVPQCFPITNADGSQRCGAHYHVCVRCDKILSVPHEDANNDCLCDISGLLAHSHEIVNVPEKAATCTEDGYRAYSYYVGCNKPVVEKVIIGAHGHRAAENYTAVDEDTHGKECLICGEFIEGTIADHVDNDSIYGCDICGKRDNLTHVPAVEPTCTEAGNYEYWTSSESDGRSYRDEFGTDPIDPSTMVRPATGHTWSEEAETYGEGHFYSCENCDATRNEAHTNAQGGSCFCDVCGDKIASHIHEEIEAVEATCETPGRMAAIFCIQCEKYFDPETGEEIDDIIIDALGHEMSEFTGNGKKHSASCQREGCNYVEEEDCATGTDNCFCDVCDAPMHGNHYVTIRFQAPTCTKNGQRASLYCEICDNYYQISTHELLNTVVIPARGHDFSDEWVNDTLEGGHSRVCLRHNCDDKITEAHELEAYDLYSGNLHEWRCSVCTYKKSEQHNYNGDSICDDCEHDTAKTVDVGAMDNDRVTVKVETDDDDDTVQEKKASFWKGFVEKIKPSYVGESQSPSAPSASVQNPLPNGSGVSSGSTGAGQTSTTTNSSGFDAVIDVLWGLLNALGNMLGL